MSTTSIVNTSIVCTGLNTCGPGISVAVVKCPLYCKVIFSDSRRNGRSVLEPTPLPGITRAGFRRGMGPRAPGFHQLNPALGITRNRCLKVLGVDIASDFSVSPHTQRLVTVSAQTVYALSVLRSHGLCDTALQHVYRATIIARLTYAASAWRGLASMSDSQCIDSVIDRARRNGYCAPDLPSFDVLCDDADDELFSKAVRLSNHVLPPSGHFVN